ncbi:Maf-like protein YhdE [Pirellulimonas nuda]|uniref:dTTP/UTP pyrophosphatase n=1 Tax=Pirellulimonas nuda TaxID=2528009 RepID=A0A518DB56_9BACT|nr:Maf family protein [Pirellulimonas nuda]QDU88717.1 Maf-like protein YhdE [Pirellulimonas nuda]
MNSRPLILASGSPRRRDLLTEAGYLFRVVPPRDGAEPPGLCSGCGPAETVADLALRKAADVADQLSSIEDDPLLLAADTVAECGGAILGKPRDEDDARRILLHLSGRRHRVYTGVCLHDLQSPLDSLVAVTELEMDVLSDVWLDAYLASGQWEGKAGAFGYQDDLGVIRITSGAASNVVGLPIEDLAPKLGRAGCFPARTGQP